MLIRDDGRCTWLLLVVAVVLGPVAARAEGPATSYLGSLLSTGGYIFVSGSADDALGSPKFYRSAEYYDRPWQLDRAGKYEWTWGFEYHSASSNLFRFSGGNAFTLIGAALRAAARPQPRQLQPYLSAGLYAGRIESERLNISEWAFAPSAAVGVLWAALPQLTLNLHFRVVGDIERINPSGVGIGVKWSF